MAHSNKGSAKDDGAMVATPGLPNPSNSRMFLKLECSQNILQRGPNLITKEKHFQRPHKDLLWPHSSIHPENTTHLPLSG